MTGPTITQKRKKKVNQIHFFWVRLIVGTLSAVLWELHHPALPLRRPDDRMGRFWVVQEGHPHQRQQADQVVSRPPLKLTRELLGSHRSYFPPFSGGMPNGSCTRTSWRHMNTSSSGTKISALSISMQKSEPAPASWFIVPSGKSCLRLRLWMSVVACFQVHQAGEEARPGDLAARPGPEQRVDLADDQKEGRSRSSQVSIAAIENPISRLSILYGILGSNWVFLTVIIVFLPSCFPSFLPFSFDDQTMITCNFFSSFSFLLLNFVDQTTLNSRRDLPLEFFMKNYFFFTALYWRSDRKDTYFLKLSDPE